MNRTTVSERNRLKIAELHPFVQLKVGEYLATVESQLGIVMLITDGYRSLLEQGKLYAIGRSKPGRKVTWVKPGHSFHQFKLAADIYPLLESPPAKFIINFDGDTPEGRAYLAFAECTWPLVRAVAQQIGFGLINLAKDPAHIQWTGGWTCEDLLVEGYGQDIPLELIPLPKPEEP